MSSLATAAHTRSLGASRRPAPRRSTEAPVVEITIAELARIEERLAAQAHLGDLHPAHARRLAAVSAELDRRWNMFA